MPRRVCLEGENPAERRWRAAKGGSSFDLELDQGGGNAVTVGNKAARASPLYFLAESALPRFLSFQMCFVSHWKNKTHNYGIETLLVSIPVLE
jgi:hypothetical protein